MMALNSSISDSSTEDALANQTVQQTKQYGGSSGRPYVAMLGQYVKSIAFYKHRNQSGALAGLELTFNDGQVVKMRSPVADATPTVTLDLSNDSISKLYINLSSEPVFGTTGGIEGFYFETVRGQKVTTTPGNTPSSHPSDWTLVTTSSGDPCTNAVLVGMAGRHGEAIDAASFYFKNDTLMSHGMTEVVYSPAWEIGQPSLLNVAKAQVSNRTGAPQQLTISFQESVSSSYTFTTTAGVTLGMETTVQAGVPFVANGEVKVSATASFEMSYGVSKTLSNAFSYSAIVDANPGEVLQANAVASSHEIRGTYTAVTGELWAHAGAITKRITGSISGISAYDVEVNYEDLTPAHRGRK